MEKIQELEPGKTLEVQFTETLDPRKPVGVFKIHYDGDVHMVIRGEMRNPIGCNIESMREAVAAYDALKK